MNVQDALRSLFGLVTMERGPLERELTASFEEQIAQRVARRAVDPFVLPSADEALGVPAIFRAVSLIAGSVGALSMEAFQYGVRMAETPRILTRPNPYETPRDFYYSATWNMASRGETVLYIANRDGADNPTALVVVPLDELRVDENLSNRLFPRYTWQGRDGTLHEGTRYAPVANPTGDFVHIFLVREALALRGKGPLQICGAAASVAVEAQRFAATYFAGGPATDLIKYNAPLSPDPDENGNNEAQRLALQWAEHSPGLPRVVGDTFDDVKDIGRDPAKAQMTETRAYSNGDAARMFGIPGRLLEYAQQGTTLTYQNLAEVWLDFLRGSLHINYLEPIEQAMSDLLPRSTAARFNIDGLQRADAKTRAEVYQILAGIIGTTADGKPQPAITVGEIRQREGLAPGNVEYAPVLPAPPQAIMPHLSTGAEWRCLKCNKKLAETQGAGTKIRCKCGTLNEGAVQPQSAPAIILNFPERFVHVETPVTVQPAPVTIAEGAIRAESNFAPLPVTVQVTDEARQRFEALETEEAELSAHLSQLDEAEHALEAKVAKPRKQRVIAQRDGSGRLVSATVEQLPED